MMKVRKKRRNQLLVNLQKHTQRKIKLTLISGRKHLFFRAWKTSCENGMSRKLKNHNESASLGLFSTLSLRSLRLRMMNSGLLECRFL